MTKEKQASIQRRIEAILSRLELEAKREQLPANVQPMRVPVPTKRG